MHALTIRQPWATLIVNGAKDVENRSWRPPRWALERLDGWGSFTFAVHAGVGLDKETAVRDELSRRDPECLASLDEVVEMWGGYASLPRAAIVGIVDVVGVVTPEHALRSDPFGGQFRRYADSPWFSGPWGWALARVRPIAPVPVARGRLGLWELGDEVDAVRRRAFGSLGAGVAT